MGHLGLTPLEILYQERLSTITRPPALFLMPLGMTLCSALVSSQWGWP